jgi:PAS domain S-box-containing protein
MEAALRESEKYLTTLINSTAEVIFVVKMPEIRVEFVNRAVRDIFGYRPKEVIGQATRMFYPDESGFLAFGQKLQAAIADGDSQLRSEQELRRKNGDRLWAEINTTFLFSNGQLSQVISVIRDVTERKQAEEALRGSQERLRAIVDNLVDGVITIDDTGVVQSFNPGAERIFGYAPDEVCGRNVNMLMPELDVSVRSVGASLLPVTVMVTSSMLDTAAWESVA